MYMPTSSGLRDCAQQYEVRDGGDIAASFRISLPQAAFHAPTATPSMASMVKEVADKHGLSVWDLKGYSRKRAVAHPRQEFMWRARQFRRPDGSYRYSLHQLGRFLGGRDHSTIHYGAEAHEARMREATIAEVRADNARMAALHGGR